MNMIMQSVPSRDGQSSWRDRLLLYAHLNKCKTTASISAVRADGRVWKFEEVFPK